MRSKLERVAGSSWAALGVGANIQGRIGFLGFTVSAAVAIFSVLRARVGIVTTIIVVVFTITAVIGFWLWMRAVRQEDSREALARVTGTFIPPGYAAIVTGQQAEPGEWVPPGFDVVMGQGMVSDARGNVVSGPDSRVYNGSGNTVTGAESKVGEKPY